MVDGIILKGIGGFYYVEASGKTYECKARGIFRKDGIKPLAGDRVRISIIDDDHGAIEEILPRTSVISRPPVANIDRLFIIAAVRNPDINLPVIDRLTAIACYSSIEPCIVISKKDLDDGSEYADIYRKSGFKTFVTSCVTGEGVDEIREALKGHISAFTGNTGAGKSSLLNSIFPSLDLATGEISDKLGRGRHTTRQSELIKVDGGYVADTPGFSSYDVQSNLVILKDELAYAFPEFEKYLGTCKFSTCTHTTDRGCSIIEAVKNGEIPISRHESYVALYNEAKKINEWELKK